MVRRWARVACLVPLCLLAATAQAALLALMVRTVALDQPSLALLLLPWGQRWALLLACSTAAAVLLRPAPRLPRFICDGLTPVAVSMTGLVLCLLAGALAALAEQLRITSLYTGLPHPARQAAAEAMVNTAEWTALPLAAAMAVLMVRPWRAGSARAPSGAPDR